MRRTLVLAALLVLPATAAAQSTAGTIRAGTYDLDITFNGGVMQGSLVITTRDSIAAVLRVGDHQSPVAASGHRGSHLTLDSTAPGVTVHYDLDFEGDRVSGQFTYNGNDGSVSGRRRAADR